MSSLLFAELSATCNALGFSDGSKYYCDPHCKETVRDLIRYLRRDDANHEIRRHLGEAQLVQTDLLPILKQEWKDPDLFDLVIRLLVNLTNPALLLYGEELPTDKTSRNHYLQIISQLQANKKAFTDADVWEVIKNKISKLLETDWSERSSEHSMSIERLLILARNVLQVPADPTAERLSDSEPSVHDQVLWALHVSGMVDVFLYLASSESEQYYYMHILEIVSLMLREQKASELATAAPQRSVEEKSRDEAKLVAVRNNEIRKRQEMERRFKGARHSRFGGTFVLKDMKSISDNSLIYHKPLNRIEDLTFDIEKRKVKTPKNKQPMKCESIERKSAYSVRLFLKEFCIEFLIGAYNTLMHHVKGTLVRAKSQAYDETYYLWAMKFFMEFNRHYKFQVKLVSETMSIETFHFVQTQAENCYANLVCDKKKIALWSRRMHLALKAYQELLMTLMAMDRTEDASIRDSARVIKSNIFYVIEYRELIFTLLVNYSELKMSRPYLRDLMETAHVFLKMLEQFCAKGTVVVQKPAKSRAKRKKKRATVKATPVEPRPPEQVWEEEVGPQLLETLTNISDLPDVVPFDAASELSIDDQKSDAVKRIQRHLRKKEFDLAIALLRASREVWPENDTFGRPNTFSHEEQEMLRDIYVADLNQPMEEPEELADNEDADDEGDEDEEEEEEEDGASHAAFSEQSFQFMDFVKRFAHPRVVEACALLLSQFEQNPPLTNHSALKMLHRIAWDCKMYVMCFQASLFRTFQRVLDSTLPEHKELAKFAIFIVRKFAEVAKTNPKLYIEMLFWKTSKDAYDIEYGYGSYQQKHSSAAKQAWSEEEEHELRTLYEEYMANPDNQGLDAVDFIMQNLISQDRSRRGVSKKLRQMGFIVPKSKGSKIGGSMRPPKEWSEQEVAQLRQLFEEFKDASDPLGCIVPRLDVKRPKMRVKDKIVELGLVTDRSELRKRRTSSKPTGNPVHIGGHSSGDDDLIGTTDGSESDDSDSGSDDSSSRRAAPARPTQKKKPQQAPLTKPQRNRKVEKPVGRKKTAAVSTTELAKILKEVVDAGMTEALSWIQSCLEEEASDRTGLGPWEPIPLLPLNEPEIIAVDNALFERLLTAIGLSPPIEGQEVYWRIPTDLSGSELRSRASVIAMAVEGRLPQNNTDAKGTVVNGTSMRGNSSGDEEENSSASSDHEQDSEAESMQGDTVAPPLSYDHSTPWSQNIRKAAREAALAEAGIGRNEKPASRRKKVITPVSSDSDLDEDISLASMGASGTVSDGSMHNTSVSSKKHKKKEVSKEESGKVKNKKRNVLGHSNNSNGVMGSETSEILTESVNAISWGQTSNTPTVTHKRKRRIQVASDSDPDDPDPTENLATVGEPSQEESTSSTQDRTGKRRAIVDSASEDDGDESTSLAVSALSSGKRGVGSDSDREEMQPKKIRQAIISDEDE